MMMLRNSRVTYWTGSVKALGKAPLALIHLRRSTGDVVCRGVAQYIVHGGVLTNIFRIAADYNSHFRLVVTGVIQLGYLGENGRRRPRVREGGRGFQEQGWEMGDREGHFVRMGGILLGDALAPSPCYGHRVS